MERSNFTRLLSVFLVLITVIGMLPMYAFASSGQDEVITYDRSLEEVKELLNAISCNAYLKKYENIPVATKTVKVMAADYDKELTDAAVKVLTDYNGQSGKSLQMPNNGTVGWKFNVPEEGMYSIRVHYTFPENSKSTSIERTFYIDGKVPFAEARYLVLTKAWKDDYQNGEFGVFSTDINGNDIRPTKSLLGEWRDYSFCDSTGFYVDDFSFYFSKGEHSIQLEATREELIAYSFELYPVETLPTYDEYIAKHTAEGAKNIPASVEAIKINAETPDAVSEKVIYPIYDRTSAITDPQDAALIKLNTIGGAKWLSVGQWVRYEIEVKESGFYNIVTRFKQSILTGMYTSRRLRINGEIPFEEASYLQYNFNSNWQVSALNNGEREFLVYLEAGKNEIQLEVVLGGLADLLRQVDECLTDINSAYLKILMITGASPDQYRDYGFGRRIPEEIKKLAKCADILTETSKKMVEIIGEKGQHVATLDTVALLVKRMSSDEDEIAKNLVTLKSYLGTLGTWLQTSQRQSLEIDYIMVQSPEEKLPRAKANVFEAVWHETKSFIMSFVTDYDTVGATHKIDEDETVVMWTQSGRDQAQILRQLVDYDFTPETGIAVTLKLVSGGLLQAVLAGVGPDVAYLASTDCINWAIRSALVPLDEMEGFDEVTKDFNEESLIPLRLYDDKGDYQSFGLPTTMDFLMMFYRMDVFAELGIEIPETWDGLYEILPKLQNNNMEVAFPSKLAGTQLLLYQMGGELYADNGKRINLDSNVGLSAFQMLCDLFEKYRFPLTYTFSNRFRTGEMPLGVVDYTNYNTLTVYASELKGMWEFTPIPGFEQEDGSIRNVSTLTVTGLIMTRNTENKEAAWELMKWYVSPSTQGQYGTELVAILGSAAKYHTANLKALEEMPWTTSEYRALEKQMNSLAGIPNYPGGYIITRYVDFAFLKVYNDSMKKGTSATSTGVDPVESILNYVVDINKELSRKRKEFGMEYYDISNSTSFIEAAES